MLLNRHEINPVTLPGDIAIPRARDIDYSDAEEVYAYSRLLVRLLEWHGGLDAPRSKSAVVRAIDAECETWLTEVKRLLTGGTLSAIPDLLEAYMFLHHICRGCEDTAFYNEVRIRAVKRRLGGDKSLTETQAVCLLWPMVSADPRRVDQRYATYCSTILGSWIKELRQFGHFNGITDAEAYQRLNYLLNHDLFAFIAGGTEVERTTKLNWANAYLVDDFSSLDTATLKAYIPFARTVCDLKRIPFEDSEAEYVLMAEELSSRPDLHPLYREAIMLGIETRKRLSAVCCPEETA